MRGNRSQHAVLGLLATGPRTGYEVQRDVTEILGHFWRESDGQVYPELARLSHEGLAERVDESERRGRRRYRYHITEDGLEQLAEWLGQPVVPTPPRHELLLKLFFGRHARRGDLPRVLADYRKSAQEAHDRLKQVAASVKAQSPDDPDLDWWLLTIDFGLRSLRAVLEWCDEAIPKVQAMEGRR